MQERNFVQTHLLFRYDLDSHSLACFLVSSCMHFRGRSFTQLLIDIVIVVYVSLSSGLLDNIYPFLFLLLACKVILSVLILREDKFYRVERLLFELFLFGHISKKDSCEIMHALMIVGGFFFVYVKLFADKTVKVDLQICLLLRTCSFNRLAVHLSFITQLPLIHCLKDRKL